MESYLIDSHHMAFWNEIEKCPTTTTRQESQFGSVAVNVIVKIEQNQEYKIDGFMKNLGWYVSARVPITDQLPSSKKDGQYIGPDFFTYHVYGEGEQ